MKLSARKRGMRDLTRDMDRLCREVVFLRAGHKCERCGKTQNLQWCHVYSRRYTSVRWDLSNSFCGCAGCHLWWHHKPMDAAQWWEHHIGEKAATDLRMRVARAGRRPDYSAVKLNLESELAKLRGAA